MCLNLMPDAQFRLQADEGELPLGVAPRSGETKDLGNLQIKEKGNRWLPKHEIRYPCSLSPMWGLSDTMEFRKLAEPFEVRTTGSGIV